jgi:hypothetical protein
MQREDRGGGTMAPREHGVEFRTHANPRSAWITSILVNIGMSGIHERRAFMPGPSCLGYRISGDGRRGPVAVARRSGSQAGTALGATTGENLAAVGGLHAGTETVVALALEVAGLVSALGGHDRAL